MATATGAKAQATTARARQARARQSRLGLLQVLRRRHLRPHKIYLRRDKSMALFLNPKTGTQTFRAILHAGLKEIGAGPRVGRHYPIKPHRRWVMAPLADYIDLLRHPQRYRCYAFVRNPYARLLSAWKNKFGTAHRDSEHKRTTRMLLPKLRRFAARRDLPGARPDAPLTFETFLAWVESQPEGRRDHHWDTQRAILHLDLLKYHRLFRMETEFVDGLIEVLARAGLPRDFVARRAVRKKNATKPLAAPVYNEQLAERVYNLYRCDFDLLGYDRDSWEGLV